MTPSIEIARIDHVALVVLDRPPHNHVDLGVLTALADAFQSLDEDSDVRAAVLAAEGRVFCAGAELGNLRQSVETSASDDNPFNAQLLRLATTRVPMIAAVQGPAIGAGLGLAAIADFRIASPEARFSANFVKLGFHPILGLTHTLPAIVGAQKAALMLLTGRRLKAEAALALGLIDDLVAASDLRSTALALAQEIAANAPLAVRSVRDALRDGLEPRLREAMTRESAAQAALARTVDFAEGIRAASERRAGRFVGR